MAGYLDLEGLKKYDTKLKAYMATKDAEVLDRAGITIEKATTPTTGSVATYVVKQDYSYVSKADGTTKISADAYNTLVENYKADQKLTTPTGVVNPATLYDVESKEIGKIEIPLDHAVESGSLVTTAKTSTTPAKAEIVLVLANTTDATTTSGKKEVRVDISTVAGDITDIQTKITALEATHATKVVGTDTVLKTVTEQITEEAKSATYKAESAAGAGDGETIGQALARFESDLTYKGTTTVHPTSPSKGDLYNFNIAATDPDGTPDSGDEIAEIKGWKFWDGSVWQSLDDPTLAARVGVLEGQVGKDKTVTAYQTKTDLVDIVNVLTGADTVAGSVLKAIKDNAGLATSDVKGVDKYEEIANPGTFKTIAEYEALSTTDKALYQAVEKDLTINEAIKDAKDAATAGSVVTVEKQATAESGFSATYVVKQNGTAVGDKINIPKDFLVKSADIKTAPTGGVLGSDGTTVVIPEKHKYIDFVVNSKDGKETETHIYLDVLDLVEDFTVRSAADVATKKDEVQLAVDANRELSATLVDASIARKKVDADFEKDLKAIENAIGYVDPTATTKVLQSVSATIEKEAKDGIYKAAVAESAPGAGDGKAAVTIAEAIKALEDSASDTNGAFVMKGDVADLTALNAVASPKKGDAYYVTDIKSLYIRTDSAWKKLSVDGEFTVGNGGLNKAVDIKKYIDSRIFVGSQAEADAALLAGTIDDSTFTVIIDENAEGLAPIDTTDIDSLF